MVQKGITKNEDNNKEDTKTGIMSKICKLFTNFLSEF